LVASSDDLFELGGFSVGEIGVALAIFFDEGDQVVLGPDCGLNRVANGGVIFAEITDGAVIGAALASESDGLEVFGAGVFEAATEASMARTGLAKVTWSSAAGGSRAGRTPGVRDALLAPTADPALPDVGRSFFRAGEEEELRAAWSRASIRRWRQQSVPHSGFFLQNAFRPKSSDSPPGLQDFGLIEVRDLSSV
jgi:hypothetical protein